MAFTPIQTTQIAAGQPVTQNLFTTVKTDFDDHESRIETVENATSSQPPIEFDIIGSLNSPLSMTGALTYRVPYNMTLLACRLLIVTAGTSGTTEVDVQYKRGAGSWTTILTGPIDAVYTGGNDYLVSGTLAVTSLLTGDLLRLNINSVQNASQDFSVYVEQKAS